MPSTKRKLDSARANGAKSRGPVTPEGLRNSAQANITHGLTTETVCLSNESRPRFLQILQEYTDEYQPVGPTERDLLEEMVAAKWEQRRIWSIRTATLDLRLALQRHEVDQKLSRIDEPGRLAIALGAESDKSKALALLLRYEGAHHRAYHKALNTLRKLQNERFQAEPTPDGDFPEEPNPVIEQPPAASPEPRVIPIDAAPSSPSDAPHPKMEHTPQAPTLCACGRWHLPDHSHCVCGRKILNAHQ